MGKSIFGRIFNTKENQISNVLKILNGEQAYESHIGGLELNSSKTESEYYVHEAASEHVFSDIQKKMIEGNPNIFVSSTFVDMQRERDILHYNVLPKLRRFAEKYKQSIGFTDLRWGIDTTDLDEEKSSRKIIEICNREIDKARPYILVLVGDRYGWIPGGSEKSVTEMEIEYGAFSRPENRDKTLFLIRNINESDNSEGSEKYMTESENAQKALDKLKNKIRTDFSDRLIEYDAIIKDGKVEFDENALTEAVVDRLEEMLENDFGSIASMTEQEKNYCRWLNVFNNSKGKYAEVFGDIELIKRRADEGTILQFIEASEGKGGTSALMMACHKMSEGYKTYGYVPESGVGKPDAYSLVHQLIWYAEDALGINHVSENLRINELRTKFGSLLKKLDDKKIRTAFFVDSPSSFGGDKAQLELISERSIEQGEYKLTDCANVANWMPAYIPEYARFIIADYKGIIPYSYQEKRNGIPLTDKISLKDIDGLGQALIAESYCMALGKELPENVADAFRKAPSRTPLHTKLGCIGLMNLSEEDFDKIRVDGRGMDSLSEYMASYVNSMCETEEGESWRAMTNVANKINPELIEHFLLPMAAGYAGYRIRDLVEISGGKLSELDIVTYLEIFKEFFIEDENGFCKYRYEKLRNLNKCLEVLGRDCNRKFYARILQYMRKLDWNDLFKINDYQLRLTTMFIGGDLTVIPEFVSNIVAQNQIEDEAKRKWALFRTATSIWLAGFGTGRPEKLADALYEAVKRKTSDEVANLNRNAEECYKKTSHAEELFSLMRVIRIYVLLHYISDNQEMFAGKMFEFVGLFTELVEEQYKEYDFCPENVIDDANTFTMVSKLKNDQLMETAVRELAMSYFTMGVMSVNTKWANNRTMYLTLASYGLELLNKAFPDNREYMDDLAAIYEWIGFDEKKAGKPSKEYFIKALALFQNTYLKNPEIDKISTLRGMAIESNYISDCNRENKDYNAAFMGYQSSLNVSAEILKAQRSQLAYSDVCVALKKLAYLSLDQGEYDKAAGYIKDGISVAETGLREFPGDRLIKDMALLHECAGFLLTKMGAQDEAADYFKKCLDVYKKYEDITDPEYISNIELAKENYKLAGIGKLKYPN